MSESAETVSVYVHVPFCRSKCRLFLTRKTLPIADSVLCDFATVE